jgi:hypothetical protein
MFKSMKYVTNIRILIVCLFVQVMGCTKDEKPPVDKTNKVIIETSPVTNVSAGVSRSGGNILTDGGEAITMRGICWSTNEQPILGPNSFNTEDGKGSGVFTSTMNNLLPLKTYYVRAYAKNIHGVIYGNTRSFVSSAYPPSVDLSCPVATSTISQNSARVTLNITKTGGGIVNRAGFIYSKSPSFNPRTAQPVPFVNGTFTYNANLINLETNTVYYVKAYSLNNLNTDTGWSQPCSFRTLPAVKPVLSAICPTTATQNSFTITATISATGGAPITEAGFEYSINPNFIPSSILSLTPPLPAVNQSFTRTISSGISPGTLYYVRAYAKNGQNSERGYSSPTCQIRTLSSNPIVSTTCSPVVNGSIVTLTGSFVNPGNQSITDRGFYYSPTSLDPQPGNSLVTSSGSGASPFNRMLDLNACTDYYYRAYVSTSTSQAPILATNVCSLRTNFTGTTLNAPANTSNINRSVSVTFSWKNITCTGTSYVFELSRNSNFTATGGTRTLISCSTITSNTALNFVQTTATSVCVNTNYTSHSGVWYWRVKTINGAQQIVSPTWSYNYTY